MVCDERTSCSYALTPWKGHVVHRPRSCALASVPTFTLCHSLALRLHCVLVSAEQLYHTAIHCDTLQHTATHCSAESELARLSSSLHSCERRATAPHGNTLQHTAPHCTTPQHCAVQKVCLEDGVRELMQAFPCCIIT